MPDGRTLSRLLGLLSEPKAHKANGVNKTLRLSCHCSRNKLFLKFPGRDLGGVLAFLRGFRRDAWLALGGLLLSLPAALALAVLVLRLAGLHESQAWGYGANTLLYSAAVAQQVTQGDLGPSRTRDDV